MKCLDCGFDVQESELDEHERHDIVPGSFRYEDDIQKLEQRIAELTAALAVLELALLLATTDVDNLTHPWSAHGQRTVDQQITDYMERASRKE